MILGYLAFALNHYSKIVNIVSFVDRPHYRVGNATSHVDEFDNPIPSNANIEISSKCSINMTETLAKLINKLDTNYVVGMYCLCTIFELLSLILFTIIVRKEKENFDQDMYIVSLMLCFACMFLSIVLSLPGSYGTKVNYGKCIECYGLMKKFIHYDSFMLNFLVWIFVLSPLYPPIRKSCFYECKEDWWHIGDFCIILTIIGIVGYSLAIKFGSIYYFQVFWDGLLFLFVTYISYKIFEEVIGS